MLMLNTNYFDPVSDPVSFASGAGAVSAPVSLDCPQLLQAIKNKNKMYMMSPIKRTTLSHKNRSINDY